MEPLINGEGPLIQREGMGLCFEWHYTMRVISGWIYMITNQSGRVILCIHTRISELCNAIQITGQTFCCLYIIPSDVNLRNGTSVLNSFTTSD